MKKLDSKAGRNGGVPSGQEERGGGLIGGQDTSDGEADGKADLNSKGPKSRLTYNDIDLDSYDISLVL